MDFNIAYEIYDEGFICRHMSNQTRRSLLSYDHKRNRKNYERSFRFVYCLIVKNEIVYVGKTTNHWMLRVMTHRSKFKFDKVMIIDFWKSDFEHLDDMEKYYIKKFKPKLNNNGFTNRFEQIYISDYNRTYEEVLEILDL